PEEHTETSEIDLSLCFVGRFMSDKPTRFQLMQERMSLVWRPLNGISISQINDNLFLFQFFHVVDFQRVL
ncbi:hypothetical protein glysoja_005901, partial [Glycine soja]